MASQFYRHRRSFRFCAVTLLCLLGLATQAQATALISCAGSDGDAGVDVLFGAGPVPSVLDVTFSVGAEMFSTQGRDGMGEAVIARAYVDDDIMRIDMMDIRLRDLAPIGIACDGP